MLDCVVISIIFLTKCYGTLQSQEYPGTVSRPILSDQEAEALSVQSYLDPWIPENIDNFRVPDYYVGQNHAYFSIQSAVNAAILENINSTSRQLIYVNAGVYKETVYIPADSVPITLYGETGVQIVLNQTADMMVSDWIQQVNPNGTRYVEGDPAYSMFHDCAKIEKTIGTRCTSVIWIKSANTQLVNVIIENSAEQLSDAPGVALRTDSDAIHLEGVTLLGHQDTLYVASGKTFVNNSYLEGDVDYVFGQGTAVFNNCTFKTVADRKSYGIVFAPKTDSHNRFGFLIVNSILTSDEQFQNNSNVLLGRSWDSSEYIPDESPNGQILIRESRIDAIINTTGPWGDGINSKRAFSGNIDVRRNLNDNRFNRFWEYRNYGDYYGN